jgi:hypothetical protein
VPFCCIRLATWDLFILQQGVDTYDFVQQQIQACDQKIELALAAIPTAAPVAAEPPPLPVAAAATLLRVAAVAVGRTGTWLGVDYRRMKAKKGGPKAVTATARKLAGIIYPMLKFQQEHVMLDKDKYIAPSEAHRLRYLKREAKKLGYDLVAAEHTA